MALKMEKRLQAEKCKQHLGTWKGKGMDSSLELPEGMWASNTLILEILISRKIINVGWFPLNLWLHQFACSTKFVTAAIGNQGNVHANHLGILLITQKHLMVGLGKNESFCISRKFPGDPDAAGCLWITRWAPGI